MLLALAAILSLSPVSSRRVWAQQPAPEAAGAVSPDEVVLTVGDQKFTAAEFDKLTRSLPPDVASALAAMGKRGFAERYANLLSLAKEGQKRKIDQDENFSQMLEFQRMMMLAQFTLNSMVTSMPSISDDEISYYYTAHQPDFQQLKLRGIYISFEGDTLAAGAGDSKAAAKPGAKPPAAKPKLTEAEAKAKAESLRQRIVAGENMATLAKKESEHASAANGGDLGFVRRGQYTPQIDNVIFALEPGKVSIPVKDRFGYFIFQLQEKRTQPLEEAKPLIENGLRQQKIGDLLTKVQADNPVIYNPRYFTESAPGMTATPGTSAAPAAPRK